MSSRSLYVTPRALVELKSLPGNMRQRVKRAIQDLKNNPRPSQSRRLRISVSEPELRRLRIDRWRILYTISDNDLFVDVLAVRKRPPYDYGDIDALLREMS